MSIKTIFGFPITRAALSTLSLIIMIVLGIWITIELWIRISFIVILAIINFCLIYFSIKRPPGFSIENFLRTMVNSIWGGKANHFRANVMLYNPKTKKSEIKYAINMDGHKDRYFQLDVNKGCTGHAFQHKKPYWVDLTKVTHQDYLVDPTKVWEKMKSILSVPIFDPENPQKKPLGTLNVDADLKLKLSKLNKEKVYLIVNTYSDWIGKLLKR
ncbi:MAG: hypothetical protein GH150_00875 [Hadesarchaea archaeon]|nr:hypothetical protein [Hadesarchaea archaeon]